MNSNFKVSGLTRLGIKPQSTASETDTRPSKLLKLRIGFHDFGFGSDFEMLVHLLDSYLSCE